MTAPSRLENPYSDRREILCATKGPLFVCGPFLLGALSVLCANSFHFSPLTTRHSPLVYL
jgi:hypothetical protein